MPKKHLEADLSMDLEVRVWSSREGSVNNPSIGGN